MTAKLAPASYSCKAAERLSGRVASSSTKVASWEFGRSVMQQA